MLVVGAWMTESVRRSISAFLSTNTQHSLSTMKELQEIQSLLKAPKNQFNKFGKFNYRSCEDILEAVKPLLVQHKCILILNDDVVNIGDRYYVKATATIRSEKGEECSSTAYAREADDKSGMDSAQITGSASSYARKYALNGLFCIDDNKDPDSSKNRSARSSADADGKPKPELTPSHVKWDACVRNVKSGKYSVDDLRGHYTISAEVERRLIAEANG